MREDMLRKIRQFSEGGDQLSERIAYFSICSLNYLSFARTLAQSLRAATPQAEFYLFVADRWNDAAVAAVSELQAIAVETIGVPNLLDMAFRYDILEFNTSVKPYCFDYLFSQMGFDRAIYLDPDIYVLRPFDHVLQAFADGADCILTPHITQPIDDGGYPGEIELLMSGVYNLGFAAFANSPDSRRFLAWWRQKLATGCVNDTAKGIFVDQRYCDFAPAFIDRMTVLRHPGYNLAYWNMMYQTVKKSDGAYITGSQPIYFVHFSGIDPQRPALYSVYQDRLRRPDLGALGPLYDDYLAQLESNDFSNGLQFSKIPYGFGTFASGAPIQSSTRHAYRSWTKGLPYNGDPFLLSSEELEENESPTEMTPELCTIDSVLEAQHAALRAEYAALEAHYAALLQENTVIKGSTTWRVVAPLGKFLSRHPGVSRPLRLVAKLAWWTVTLQLPSRIAARLKPRLTSAEFQTFPVVSATVVEAPIFPPASAAVVEAPIFPPASAAVVEAPIFPPASEAVVEAPRFQVRSLLPTATEPWPQRPSRRLICVTHVLLHPPHAGNAYRISRMLSWLSKQGWEVLLVVCPLAYAQLDEHQIRELATAFPNLIVCRRDGTLLHHLSWDGAMLEKLNGRCPRSFVSALGEDATSDERSQQTTDLLRMFCPDVLVELLLHLEEHFDPEIMLAEYIFMARPFPLFRPKLRKVIDTIDVFSNKQRKVEHYGIKDDLTLVDSEEASLLNRANLLLAIQPDEAVDLRQLAPSLPVISVGVDFDIVDHMPSSPTAPVILLIASDNKMNVKGLKDFLRFAWPLVRREVPDAELRVVGPVGDTAEVALPAIRILGRVDDVSAAYAEARVVINPAVAGTGLKIKTAEALCHFRPIILWPSGVEGIAPEVRKMCHVANDWFDFAQRVISLARSEDNGQDFEQRRRELMRHFATDCVYSPLAEALLDRSKNA